MFSKLFSSKKSTIFAPISGEAVDLEQVPDPVFAKKMTGDGVAIVPKEGKVVAPFDGKVVHQFETNHAIIVENSAHIQVLIHIGIDTVQQKGEGFVSHVQIGDTIKKGDLLIEFDLNGLKTAGYEIISPIVIVNGEIVQDQKIGKTGMIKAGSDELLLITLK
jgi:glucose-specific phosphotransferase system IIA component